MSAEVEAKVADPTTESKAEEVKPVEVATTNDRDAKACAEEGEKEKSKWDNFRSHFTPAAASSLREAARDLSTWLSLRAHILTMPAAASEKKDDTNGDAEEKSKLHLLC